MTGNGFALGNEPSQWAAQYGFLLAVSLLGTTMIIITRLGTMRAVKVSSPVRLVVSLLATNLAFLGGYHLLLTIAPSESWWRMGLYVLAAVASVVVFGIGVNVLAWLIERGKAIRVVTTRYKPALSPPHDVDLAHNQGENAQLIAAGAIGAYFLLVVVGGIAALLELTG